MNSFTGYSAELGVYLYMKTLVYNSDWQIAVVGTSIVRIILQPLLHDHETDIVLIAVLRHIRIRQTFAKALSHKY